MKSKPAAAKQRRNPQPPATSDGPPMPIARVEHPPELVALFYQYQGFHFPGGAIEPAPPVPLAALVEMIQHRAGMIARQDRVLVEGVAEVLAAGLAGELLDWLAGRAAARSEQAQACIVDLSGKAVDLHLWSLGKMHAVTLQRARKAPDIPGRMSRNPEVSAYWQKVLKAIRQGSETPVPMQRKQGQKRSSRDVAAGKHQLVACLFDFMAGYQKCGVAKALGIPSNHPAIPERVREILALPPLGAQTWKAWHKVGLKIVKESTKGNPAMHPAFNRLPLNQLNRDADKQGKAITKDLSTAWEALASAKSSLESGI
jgi:hypothetical protein